MNYAPNQNGKVQEETLADSSFPSSSKIFPHSSVTLSHAIGVLQMAL